MNKIDAFFRLMDEQRASHLFLTSGRQPALRIMGRIERVRYKKYLDDELKDLLYEIVPDKKLIALQETGNIVFVYEIPYLGRYRGHLYNQRYGISAVFKAISDEIKSIEELNLPEVIRRLAFLNEGMVIITGAKESGRSTTLAAIVNEINRNRKIHIVTIEDPIEQIHNDSLSLVDQQEVGTHTRTYSTGIRNAIRTGADVISVGELRDPESIALCLDAACNGQLVLTSLSYNQEIGGHFGLFDFILHAFPEHMRPFIRSRMANGIRGVVSQVLFARKDIPDFCAALQILVCTPGARNLVLEGKTYALYSVIQTGKKYGMQLLDDAIMDLFKKGWIDVQDAYSNALNKEKFRPLLKHPPRDFTIA
jgi:twitching motility protein PilT